VEIERIQDDGEKFVLHGGPGLVDELQQIFSDVGLGISVTETGEGAANVLYTENNRDIVLRMLHDQVEE
jgi:hypothetical protein